MATTLRDCSDQPLHHLLDRELERFQSNVSGSSPFDLQDIRNAHKLIVELSVSGPQHAEALLEFSKKLWNICVDQSNNLQGVEANEEPSEKELWQVKVEHNARLRQVATSAIARSLPLLPDAAAQNAGYCLVRFYSKTGTLFASVERIHLAQQNWENCIEQWDALGMAEGMAGATPAKTLVEEKTYRDAFLAVYHLMQLHLANLRVERGLEYLLRAESMVESAEQGAMLAAAVASAASKLLDDRDAVNALSCFEKCANYYEKLMEQDGQVHALRGVAKCHLAMGNLERALTACKMALAVRTDAYSLILLLRVYLLLGDADGAAATLNQLIQSPTSSLDSIISALTLTAERGAYALAADGCAMTRARLQGESESSAQQHDGDIQDAEKEEKLWLLELELLTSHIHDYVRAIKLLDDVILPLHHSGARPLSQRARQTLYYMSFHCGKQLLQSSDWTQAREWFHRARRLVVDHATEERCHIDHHPQPPPGIAEAQAACMLAFCSVKLGDAARAITLAKEALALDSSIAAARVVLFEAFLLAGNEFEIEASAVLNEIATTVGDRGSGEVDPLMQAHDMLELCAASAESNDKESLFLKALELTLATWQPASSTDGSGGVRCRLGQVARRLLQVLLRRVPSSSSTSVTQPAPLTHRDDIQMAATRAGGTETVRRALAVIRQVVGKCESLGPLSVFGTDTSECVWLRNVSWNLGRSAMALGMWQEARACFEAVRYLVVSLALPSDASMTSGHPQPHQQDDVDMLCECLLLECSLMVTILRGGGGGAGAEGEGADKSSSVQQPTLGCSAGYREVIELVRQFRRYHRHHNQQQQQQQEHMFLIEFEATLHVPDFDVYDIIVHLQTQVEQNDPAVAFVVASTWEKLASILEAHCRESTQQLLLRDSRRRDALRACLRNALQLRQRSHDLCGAAELYRRLIEETCASRDDESPLVDAALDWARSSGSGFPQRELEWLLVRCHNNGVYFYRIALYQKAESWLARALVLLEWLSATQRPASFSSIVQLAYDQVLARLGSDST